MKKKLLLFTSIGAVFLVGISAVAISGVNQLDRLQVKADPVEYSVTFNADSSFKEDFGKYAICETTARGNKLGVVGFITDFEDLHFGETHFFELQLHDASNALVNAGANDFDHITGYKVIFSGGSLVFRIDDEIEGSSVISGQRYDVSMTPDHYPAFARDEYAGGGNVTISSLTIYYTC